VGSGQSAVSSQQDFLKHIEPSERQVFINLNFKDYVMGYLSVTDEVS
jgi:hypothetical protein